MDFNRCAVSDFITIASWHAVISFTFMNKMQASREHLLLLAFSVMVLSLCVDTECNGRAVGALLQSNTVHIFLISVKNLPTFKKT